MDRRDGGLKAVHLAFCGIGLMGSAMAERLLQAGHRLTVWNRTAAKCAPLAARGAQVARTPAHAAAGAGGVLLCLMDTQAVETVVFGPDGVARGGDCPPWIVDHSTIPPDATRGLAQRLSEAGGDWLDAPVSGGIEGAAHGTLAVMVGGAPTHLEEVETVLRAYASQVTHVGKSGAGQAAKLCNQTIVATTVAAIAEAVGMARASGIDPTRLGEALAGGWADSRLLRTFLPRMAHAPDHSIGALATMLKDIDSVMTTARNRGTAMPVTASVQQLLRQAASFGLAQAELSAIVAMVWPEQLAAFRAMVGKAS
ncbi:MAG TPA: NAD(P)-dependent oxidoreductase [Nevskiaceae bacterium]